MSDAIELELVDTVAAARYLDLSTNTLNRMRSERRGPAFYKIGDKAIRYDMNDLRAYMERIPCDG